MDLVVELELVSLKLISSKDDHNIVLADKLKDLLSHFNVALDVVRAVQRTLLVHVAENFHELSEGSLQRSYVKTQRWAILPSLKLEDLKYVGDVVLLIQCLLL